jgi:type II secretory pathway pseudopilin PulG
MMMAKFKRRGTTLIELTVVLGLLAIITLIGVKGYGLYRNIIYDIEIKQFLYDIEDTLSYGKEYCSKNAKVGDYYVEKEEETLKVIFKCVDGKKRETELPKSIIIVKDDWISEISSKSLTITNSGYIQSETINFKDEKGCRYKLTIRPGGNIITVKEEI